jgi:N-acetylneuraminate lyase
VSLVRSIYRVSGSLSAFKAVMAMVGQDCGPTRLPLEPLAAAEQARLKDDLTRIGFFRWGRDSN